MTAAVEGAYCTLTSTAGVFSNVQAFTNAPYAASRVDRVPLPIQAGAPQWASIDLYTGSYPSIAPAPATDTVNYPKTGSGAFTLVDSLPTGIEPAQVIAADVTGSGEDDLIVRNAGDGTISIFLGNGLGGFNPPITLSVGFGASDVSVASLAPNSLPAILVSNENTGQVEIIRDLGVGLFAAPAYYRAGGGISAVLQNPDASLSVVSVDGTIGVAVFIPAPGAPAAACIVPSR